ncbi:MAG: ketoacyl-ACP synthase III [bacterium]|nr:ketoacyl-ACP synthase III [bacterium]
MRSVLAGTGRALPETIISNYDLEKIVDTSDEWIVTRTGIRTRFVAKTGSATSDLCAQAGKIALERANLSADELDFIIVGTVTGDMKFPSTAVYVQSKLGAKKATAFDIAAACTGFIYGMDLADSFIRTGKATKVLVIGGEILTSMLDWEDRATAVLFGDGAGAAVFVAEETEEKVGILSTYSKSDGTLAHLLYCPGCGSINPPSVQSIARRDHYIKMSGNEVFKHAVRMMRDSAVIGLERAGITMEELDLLIPHQANIRIIEATQERLKLPNEKVYVNLDRYGNTSAASIPIALDEAIELGKLKKGMTALFVAFGGGFTWGSACLRY